MAAEECGLKEIKKELQHLNSAQLTELCLRLAKHKKENKELLAYLLFVADDEEAFIEHSKYEVSMMFYMLPGQVYNATKVLRKILRVIAKLSRFSGSKNVEIKLLIGFCTNYLEYIDRRVGYKPLRNLFIKQVEKIEKLISKLHEDLQADYRDEFNMLLEEADRQLPWFSKIGYN